MDSNKCGAVPSRTWGRRISVEYVRLLCGSSTAACRPAGTLDYWSTVYTDKEEGLVVALKITRLTPASLGPSKREYRIQARAVGTRLLGLSKQCTAAFSCSPCRAPVRCLTSWCTRRTDLRAARARRCVHVHRKASARVTETRPAGHRSLLPPAGIPEHGAARCPAPGSVSCWRAVPYRCRASSCLPVSSGGQHQRGG